MAATQTVLIDFQADFTSVQEGIDTLEKMGKVDKDLADQFRKTNTEIKKQGDAIDQTAKKSQGSVQNFSKLSDLMKQFPKSGLNRFLLDIGNQLAAAGLNAKDFYTKLDPKDAVTKQTTLRNELKQVKEQMQAAALAGGTLGAEYQRLKKRAGELDDTIRDVASDIKNAGSDTRGIDNVVGSISALAGGYSAVQGAAALFGEESEDLQKALLKVNAAMALATGIQQISNAVQKEGSLARLADTIATGGQIAVQRIYTAVTGQATAATVAFKVALAATGIGAVILLIVALSQAFKKTNHDLEDATNAVDRYNREIESMNTLLAQNLSISLARAEAAGQAESDLIRIRGNSLLQQRQQIVEANRALASQRDALDGTSAAYGKLNGAIEENNKALKQIDTDIIVAGANLTKAQADERQKQFDKNKELAEKARDEAKKQRALEFEDYKAGIELKLLASEKGSREELELQKDLLRAKLQIDLEGEDITLNQRKLLIQQFFRDRKELERSFNKDIVAAAIEDQKNRDAAALENLNLNESDKLAVKIEFLQLSAAQEITAAEGNAAKILAINAKLNSDITAAKIESIKKQSDYEIAFSSAQGGGARRALEAVAANEKLKGAVRINAILQLGQLEQAVLDRQIKANRDAIAVQGADQRALSLEYEQLLDQKAAAAEATEKKITDLTEAETKKRRDIDIAYIQATVAGLQSLADIIGGIQANDQAAADDAIKRKRREVDELLEAGAITEKEARERNRRIEIEERQAKQRAAIQAKNLAVFQAFLAIPQAYLAGLQTPLIGQIMGPIYAAIAAVQAGIIASRPIPKFATGKKGSYSGLAEVGEVGAELIQRADGSMQVATRRSMVYLGARDKVFTHGETKNMLPFVNKEAISATAKGFEFDYNKMAKAVNQKGNSTVVNIDKEFISESVANGLMKVNYWDKTYSSK